MPVTTVQLVTMLWTVTRPQKIHQHPCFCPSRRTCSPTSIKLCAPSSLFIRYIRDCEEVFSFAIKDAVHKPNLKSTLQNVITHNVESPSTLCATENHFVLQLSNCTISHLLPSEVHEWKRPAKQETKKSKGIQDYECLTFSLMTFTFVVLIGRIWFSIVFQLLMNNDLIRSYACLTLMLTMNLQAHGLRCMNAYCMYVYIA